MPKVLAIFGAGPGLSRSVAHRFGREGFRVALVARDAARLEGFVAELTAAGVQALAVPADLRDRDQLPAVVASIQRELGDIDVLMTNTVGEFGTRTGIIDASVEDIQTVFDTAVLSTVVLVREVLPGMLDRGDGALLLSNGVSATVPVPQLGNVGVASAARRSYALNLHTALSDRGVYVGSLSVGALIDRSVPAQLIDAGDFPGISDPATLERLNPDDLADTYWDMYTKRDRFEVTAGSFGT
ncbi:SDR family NAD(P)-dependent oxidoreductase [Flindersiella endophytica]